jgi:ATP-binding cassette, subfamily B, bacterial RamB/AmfA
MTNLAEKAHKGASADEPAARMTPSGMAPHEPAGTRPGTRRGRRPGRCPDRRLDRRPGRRAARVAAALLRTYVFRRPADAALLALWSAVEALPTFTLGRAVAGATDAFLAGRSHAAAGLAWLGVLLVAAAIGSEGSRRAYIRLAAIVEPLRDDLVRSIVAGAVRRCVEHGEPPDTAATARISHQAELVRDSFAGLLSSLRVFVFVAGSALAGLLTVIPDALLLVAVPLLAGLAIFAALVGAFARSQRDYVLTEESVAADSATVVTALRDVTACGGEDEIGAPAARSVRAQAGASRRAARMAAARTLAIAVGGWLPIPIVLAAAPWMLRHGATAGELLGALAYIGGGLQGALRTLVQGVGSSGVRMVVAYERIAERGAPPADRPTAGLTAGQPPADRPTAGLTAGQPPAQVSHKVTDDLAGAGPCHLELRRLTFGYGPHAVPVIRDLSLFIPDGNHLAVVGPSGIGKSTLAGLIAGMLAPDAGEVLLCGAPLSGFGAKALTRHRVLIPQEAYVFAGSLGENLAYLNPQVSPEDLDAATDLLGLRPLVTRLGGYGAHVDASVLSAGERQLIALTRAYLSPARITVLDEATCHLDPCAEERAERAFADRPGTLIVIAHRMSSALRAANVLVLDGDRDEYGDHQSLLARSPLYRDLAGYWQTSAPDSSGPHGTSGSPAGALHAPAADHHPGA